VYSRLGKNFLLAIERLARERTRLTVVADQWGTPNWAQELARATATLAGITRDELSARTGIYHLSGRGATTWYGFAKAIVASMPLAHAVEIEPIAMVDHQTPARRPAYSVLDTTKIERVFGLVLPRWEDSFAACRRASA
jgi:dTDP-4-dehydrorhamnose reductase